jgi:hypothetical protein
MARLMAFIKEFNGRRIGDGVYFDGPEAESLIEQGVAMDAKDYQKMLEDKKEHRKEMREAREDKKETNDNASKAPEAPKKDKMVSAPMKKKAVSESKSEPAEAAMRWRK